jgi:regulatory protein
MNEDRPACRRQALDSLARREHSRLELERKLCARDYSETVVAEILDELEHSHLLDNKRFAESFVRSGIIKGHGPNRIRMELIKRGIAACDSYLSNAECNWVRVARKARLKRFGSSRPEDYKETARQARFLEYRGFSSEQIQKALEFGDDTD